MDSGVRYICAPINGITSRYNKHFPLSDSPFTPAFSSACGPVQTLPVRVHHKRQHRRTTLTVLFVRNIGPFHHVGRVDLDAACRGAGLFCYASFHSSSYAIVSQPEVLGIFVELDHPLLSVRFVNPRLVLKLKPLLLTLIGWTHDSMEYRYSIVSDGHCFLRLTNKAKTGKCNYHFRHWPAATVTAAMRNGILSCDQTR
jgi:hypothetical protein